MTAWNEIMSTALLGTQRADSTRLTSPVPVTRDVAEEHLLAVAATTAVTRLAGAKHASDADPLPASSEETVRRCSDEAALHLSAILDGDFGRVLDEWVVLAARAGVRAPEEMLPSLVGRDIEHHDELVQVIGQRGRWLAGLMGEKALATDGEEVWETGTAAERRDWLERARSSDPAAARGLLEKTWGSEDARARAAFVKCLMQGLSADDEPLLESSLDDRSQAVRVAAATVLSALGGSAFQDRMARLTLALVEIGRGMRSQLEIRLPAELDEGARRDIVELKAPAGVGERAWWLSRMIRLTPLGAWQSLGFEPEKLAGLKVADNLADLVHRAWADAACIQRSTAWAEALLGAGSELTDLLAVVPQQSAEKHAARLLAGPSGREWLLEQIPRPWGLELSRAVVEREFIDRDVALALHPAVLEMLPDDAPPAVVTLLSFRHEMIKELAT